MLEKKPKVALIEPHRVVCGVQTLIAATNIVVGAELEWDKLEGREKDKNIDVGIKVARMWIVGVKPTSTVANWPSRITSRTREKKLAGVSLLLLLLLSTSKRIGRREEKFWKRLTFTCYLIPWVGLSRLESMLWFQLRPTKGEILQSLFFALVLVRLMNGSAIEWTRSCHASSLAQQLKSSMRTRTDSRLDRAGSVARKSGQS